MTQQLRVLIFYTDPAINIDENVDNWDEAVLMLQHYMTQTPAPGEIIDIHISKNL